MPHIPWMHALVLGLLGLTAADTLPANYEKIILEERQQRAQSLNTSTGWFSLVALERLKDGDISVGSAADNTLRLGHGRPHAFTLHVAGGQVSFAAVDARVWVDGKQPHRGDPVRISDGEKDALKWDDLWARVIERTGNELYLRVGDPNSPNRRGFHGLHFYPVDPAYRIVAKWVPYSTQHEVHMATVLGTTLTVESPGYAEFVLDGKTIRLDSTEEDAAEFSFRDSTSRTTTYGAGRWVVGDKPSNGLKQPGSIVIDFNKAGNWPCAYTQYGTCPLPPPQNRFDAAVPAGEKRYHD